MSKELHSRELTGTLRDVGDVALDEVRDLKEEVRELKGNLEDLEDRFNDLREEMHDANVKYYALKSDV